MFKRNYFSRLHISEACSQLLSVRERDSLDRLSQGKALQIPSDDRDNVLGKSSPVRFMIFKADYEYMLGLMIAIATSINPFYVEQITISCIASKSGLNSLNP